MTPCLLLAFLQAVGAAPAQSTAPQFGRSVLALGDLDKDGTPDIAVGAPEQPGMRDKQGVVLILSGATRKVLQTWRGETTRTLFGRSLSDTGDVDGDGALDVLVGYGQQARCELRSGRDGELLAAFDRASREVLPLGDADGDGAADLLLAYDRHLEIRSGPQGGFLGNAAYFLPGNRHEPLGDLNGDGLLDFVSGAQDPELCLSELPPALDVSGAEIANFDHQLYLPSNRKSLSDLWPDLLRPRTAGASSLKQLELKRILAAPGGDLDGDGAPDLLLLLSWQGSSTIAGLSLKSTKPLFSIPDRAYGRNALLVGHDLNADGFDDIVLAQPINIFSVGVWAHSGQDGALLWETSWPDAGVSTGLCLAWFEDGAGARGILVGSTSEYPGQVQPRIGELRLLAGSTSELRWRIGVDEVPELAQREE